MQKRLACGLVLALVSAAVPTAIAHGDPAVNAQGSFDGAGWSVVEVDDADGHWEVSITAVANQLPLQVGVTLVEDDGDPITFGSHQFLEDEDGLRVEANVAGEEVVQVHRDGDPYFRITTTYRLHVQGIDLQDARAIVWTAGDYTETSWTIAGGDDASANHLRTGSDTFLALDDDFEGIVEAEHPDEPTLRAQLLGTYKVDIDHTLVGAFTQGASSYDQLQVNGPDGSNSCPCTFDRADESAAGPGTYTFEATGVGTGTERWVAVGGADVDLSGLIS